MDKPVTAIIVGLGQRGRTVYGEYILENSEDIRVTAITDLIKVKLDRAQRDFKLPDDACFASAEEIFKEPKMADCALICTQDKDHVKHASMAIEKGYHVLLEKPISDDMEASRELVKLAEKHERHVIVCHVLRYTPFFNTIKESIENGDIGELVTVQLTENVGYWHQAHSYVRGNWRDSNETSPMILAKSCHDLDILLWLVNKSCQRVSSFGSTYLFKEEKAPEGATKRCTDDCMVRDDCPYDALDIYYKTPTTKTGAEDGGFPMDVLKFEPQYNSVMEALEKGLYGRCVYYCDNNVVDHQVVNMQCEDGVTISFTMSGFTEKCFRKIKVMGTMGCINGNMDTNVVEVWKFGQDPLVHNINHGESLPGHGGGDTVMMEEFIKLLKNPEYKSNRQTTLAKSLESHQVAMKAEESRLNNGESLKI